jgi:hypothetical protein
MNLILAFLLGASLTLVALAQQTAETFTFTTRDGREFKAVTLGDVAPDSVAVFTDSGIERLALSLLPDDLQQRFGYDPQKATEFAAARVAAAKQQARAREAQLAAQKARAEARAREETAKTFRFLVSQVTDDGAIVIPLVGHAVGNSNGLGGSVGVTYQPGSKTVFLKGIRNVAEDQRLAALAYPDGTYSFTDIYGASRTLERWVFVRLADP